METKALDSITRTTEVMRNPADEVTAGGKMQKAEEKSGSKEVELKKNYDAVSKNGDTLELSEEGKKMGEHPDKVNPSTSVKMIISDSGKKISDSILAGCSDAKLKQLYANKEITKQQYDRIMKKKKVK